MIEVQAQLCGSAHREESIQAVRAKLVKLEAMDPAAERLDALAPGIAAAFCTTETRDTATADCEKRCSRMLAIPTQGRKFPKDAMACITDVFDETLAEELKRHLALAENAVDRAGGDELTEAEAESAALSSEDAQAVDVLPGGALPQSLSEMLPRTANGTEVVAAARVPRVLR